MATRNGPVGRRLDAEHGQGNVEYALIVALVSLAAVLALGFLSGKINTVFFKSGSAVEAAAGASGGAAGGTAPTVVGVSTSGDDNDGLVENGESIVIAFSEALNLSTMCGGGWGGGTLTTLADVRLAQSGTADYISVEAAGGACTPNTFTFGLLALGGDFITGSSRTFADSTIAWSAGTSTLTVTLGGSTGAGTLLVGGSTTMTYSPHPSITDLEGLSIVGDGTSGNETWF